MKSRYSRMLLAVAGMAVGAFAQAHPDLSGVWSFTIDLPPTKLKVENDGKADFKVIDRGLAAARDAHAAEPGGRVAFKLPFFPIDVKQHHDVWVDPVDLRQGAGDTETLRHVEFGRR